MKWTDENIDKLFQESAEKVSFEYKPGYWDAFETSIPTDVPASDMTDSEIDALFKEDASQVSMDYKSEFWEEFSASLPIIVPTEEVTDTEVDTMYRESVEDLSFNYKHSYWEEMASLLSRRRRPDFLWFGFSGLFAFGLVFTMLLDQNPIIDLVNATTIELPGTAQESLATIKNNADTQGNTQQTQLALQNNSQNQFSKITDANSVNAANSANGANGTNGATPLTSEPLSNSPNTAATGAHIGRNPTLTSLDPKAVVNPLVATTATTTEHRNTEDNSMPSSPLRTLPATGIVLGNDVLAEVGTTFPGLPKAHEPARTSFYLQGIGGISQSSITPSEYLSNSYGLGAGVAINRRMWTVNLGTNILVNNYKDLILTRSAKQYGFGSELVTQDLHYRNLYTLELDLSLGYNIRRHQLKLGVRPSLAFSSKVDVTETSTTTSKGEVVESSPVRSLNYGGMVGIKRLGLKPTVGYAYNFNSGWTLGANIGTELLPSIDETFIDGANNKYYIDGQLYIRKTFKLRK